MFVFERLLNDSITVRDKIDQHKDADVRRKSSAMEIVLDLISGSCPRRIRKGQDTCLSKPVEPGARVLRPSGEPSLELHCCPIKNSSISRDELELDSYYWINSNSRSVLFQCDLPYNSNQNRPVRDFAQ